MNFCLQITSTIHHVQRHYEQNSTTIRCSGGDIMDISPLHIMGGDIMNISPPVHILCGDIMNDIMNISQHTHHVWRHYEHITRHYTSCVVTL